MNRASASIDPSVADGGVPAGACDCHVHVFGDPAAFPFDPDRVFTPGRADVGDLRRHMAALSLRRAVVVQPSVYGTDNRCTLDALSRLGPDARGVCVISGDTPKAELLRLDRAGMRGARINLRTHGIADGQTLRRRLGELAGTLGELGWHVQIFCDRAALPALEDFAGASPVPVVLDHFADVRSAGGEDMRRLLRLLRTGRVYVKLSAPHRIDAGADLPEARRIARLLMREHPDRLLWGSDWPHPGVAEGVARRRDVVEPFRQVDDALSLRRVAQWAEDGDTLRRVMVANPQRLYGFPA